MKMINISHIMSLLLKFKNKRLDHRNDYAFFKIKKEIDFMKHLLNILVKIQQISQYPPKLLSEKKKETKNFLRTTNMERICASSIDKLSQEIQ